MRKGPPRIERQGRQHGKHVLAKVGIEGGSFVTRQGKRIDDADPLPIQGSAEFPLAKGHEPARRSGELSRG